MVSSSALAENLLCAALRGETNYWPTSADKTLQQDVLKASGYHGVKALLYHLLQSTPAWHSWPSELRTILRKEAQTAAALELVRQHELKHLLRTLANADIRPLLIKGTPLAYTYYPAAALRTRGDTDCLVKKTDLETTCQVLEKLGYQRLDNAISGNLISYELNYSKRDKLGTLHVMDVHWQISNMQYFAYTFNYDELLAESVPVPALGGTVRTLNRVHTLLLACMHRISHVHSPYYIDDTPHYGGNRLIWLYDIHLLAESMTRHEWEQFLYLVNDKQVRTICLDGLKRTEQTFGTRIPQEMCASLSMTSPSRELSARYLTGSSLRKLITNVQALPSWRKRILLLKEYAFPPTAYMLAKYQKTTPLLLPLLYLRRATTGIRKLF